VLTPRASPAHTSSAPGGRPVREFLVTQPPEPPPCSRSMRLAMTRRSFSSWVRRSRGCRFPPPPDVTALWPRPLQPRSRVSRNWAVSNLQAPGPAGGPPGQKNVEDQFVRSLNRQIQQGARGVGSGRGLSSRSVTSPVPWPSMSARASGAALRSFRIAPDGLGSRWGDVFCRTSPTGRTAGTALPVPPARAISVDWPRCPARNQRPQQGPLSGPGFLLPLWPPPPYVARVAGVAIWVTQAPENLLQLHPARAGHPGGWVGRQQARANGHRRRLAGGKRSQWWV